MDFCQALADELLQKRITKYMFYINIHGFFLKSSKRAVVFYVFLRYNYGIITEMRQKTKLKERTKSTAGGGEKNRQLIMKIKLQKGL